jgi:serine/threonine protein phosphatase 1
MFSTIFAPMRDPAARDAPRRAAAARVPDGERFYVVGDIHGRNDLLARIHHAIRADIHERPAPLKRTVVYLGDYVDRGPGSREVLEMLIRTPIEATRQVYLKGNHEDMMLRFIRGDNVPHWLHNGGDAALASYGVVAPQMIPSPTQIAELRCKLLDAMPAAHVTFLESLQLMHVAGDYLFVHAGIRPGVPLDAQRPADLMWIRDPFLAATNMFGKCVVHGHTISLAPEVRPQRIGIDTGAFYSGCLTCLVLEGDRVGFLQT